MMKLKKLWPCFFRKPGKKTMTQAAVLLVLAAVTAGLFVLAHRMEPAQSAGNQMSRYVKAEVLQVLKDSTSPDPASGNRRVGEQQLRIRILEGKHKNEVMEIPNYLSALHNVYAGKGTRLVVRVDSQTNGSYTASVYNYDRTGVVYGLIAVFFILLCAAGRKKGILSLLGLLFSIFSVIFIMLPLILGGFSPVRAALIISVLNASVCFTLLDGVNRKTVSAAIGTVCGVLCAAGVAAAAGGAASLNGFNMQEAESLLLQTGKCKIEIGGLFVAGIIISALGGVMDIAVSISSSVSELHRVNPKLGAKGLFRSGIRIGRDAMGTMATTLILAFVGSSLNTMVLIDSYGIPFAQLINTDLIGVEIVQGIAASLGIIVTVPLVTMISSRFLAREPR